MFVDNYKDLEYDDELFNEDYAVNDRDYSDVDERSIEFANCLYNLLQELVNEEFSKKNEDFTSLKNMVAHYYKHCTCGKPKKSTRSNVYYEYDSSIDYMNRESYLHDRFKRVKYIISDLTDTDHITYCFRKLFEGNTFIKFSLACGLYGEYSRISLSVNSWANEATFHYPLNTVDFIIKNPNDDTITIYPLDANYLENKINNELVRCGFDKIAINH